MPLRAKLQMQQATRAEMSTAHAQMAREVFMPQQDDDPEDVLFNSLYGLRSIELNRPAKLNAINGSMIRKIGSRLAEWKKSDMANIIVIKGAGPKAFCAGGDVAALANLNKMGEEGIKKSIEYFGLEYKLDHLISTYNKPYIAFMDGITMGGGVGLSIHAPFRIATERTVFAMPETGIGFFPDVGASFFLPRMPGAVGTYLGLTSSRLTGPNVFYSGIATHYLHSSSLPQLESRLAELRFKDYDDMSHRLAVINATIEEYCTGLPHDQPILLGGELRKAIDRCFSFNTVPAIIRALEAEEGPAKPWAQQTLKTLNEKSPTSIHVTLRQMRIGAGWSILQTFQREYHMAAKFMKHHDFTEGVTARLIEKRDPKWQPELLVDIDPEDDISTGFFTVDNKLEPLRLLSDGDYSSYPYQGCGLPTESEVATVVKEGIKTQKQVLNHFLKETRHKQGVEEVVREILERKTFVEAKDEDRIAVWDDATQ
ncbi:ClpP/crotonase-like domain-containing protein [Apodospora peruviana]|uniref:3-hydroxyisobutyryl-CoA hydrolase n=1 Tax=Apodospora peruviana TaxID=516989 RepID=A0AAE0MAZ8_9PEZI|nr:ClpP/crotonase-like domain-containing protein [Apodospora peruviana]